MTSPDDENRRLLKAEIRACGARLFEARTTVARRRHWRRVAWALWVPSVVVCVGLQYTNLPALMVLGVLTVAIVYLTISITEHEWEVEHWERVMQAAHDAIVRIDLIEGLRRNEDQN